LGAGISFSDAPVDVLDVPEGMSGFRTLFSSFHHFRPDDARKILGDAVAKGEGIAVVEATHRSLVGILPMFHVPLIVWLVTPFIRPFRVSRLFWTYLVPLAPLIIGFDGIVSCLRTYSAGEMLELADKVGVEVNTCKAAAIRGKGMRMSYSVGYPTKVG